MSVESLFFTIILPFLLLMGAMIAFFVYKSRIRNPKEQVFKIPPPELVRVDCTKRLLKEFGSKTKWIPFLFIGIPLGLFLFVMVRLNFDFPESNHLLIGVILFGLLSLGSVLAYLSCRDQLNSFVKAYQLSIDKKLIFQLNSEGFFVPTLLLVNPAFWRVSEKNLHEIMIPFSDIDTIEVCAGAGSAPAQFKINPLGASTIASLGKGRLGDLDGPQFGIGIRRDLLSASEQEILALLHHHIGERLLIRTDIVNF